MGGQKEDDSDMDNIKMEAAIFFESYLPDALRLALEYAGEDGYVASMPQLLHARVKAAYDNIIWNTWFTSNSEESVVETAQGQQVVVVVHGGGIFASPERFERTFRASVARSSAEGFTGQYAAKINEREVRDLLDGTLPDGTEIPVYPFDEFKQGVSNLPRRYGVVMDFESVRKSESGYASFDVLKDEPLMIARAGGVEAAAAYLDKARDRHNTAVMGSWHPFNRVDPDQAQTRVPLLGGNLGGVGSEDDDEDLLGIHTEFGLRGDSSFINVARYVAVAPRNVSTSLRYLDFGI